MEIKIRHTGTPLMRCHDQARGYIKRRKTDWSQVREDRV
jgi:hypothetical protein